MTEVREKIAHALVVYHRRTLDLEKHYSGMGFASRAVKLDEVTADRILALIKEADWIDPTDFILPKVKELLDKVALANGYVRLAEDQTLPEIPSFAYDKKEDRELLRRGVINYSKLLASWRKVEVKDD